MSLVLCIVAYNARFNYSKRRYNGAGVLQYIVIQPGLCQMALTTVLHVKVEMSISLTLHQCFLHWG